MWTHQTGQPPTSFNIIIFITIISRVAANPNFDLLRSQTSRASPPNSRPSRVSFAKIVPFLGHFCFFPRSSARAISDEFACNCRIECFDSVPRRLVSAGFVFCVSVFFFFSRLSGWLPSQKSDQRQTSADDSDVLVAHKHSRLSPLIRSSSFRVR